MSLAEQSPCHACKALDERPDTTCDKWRNCTKWRNWFLNSWGLTTAMFQGPREPKIIAVEGYKAFTGIMLWTPKNPNYPPTKIFGDWLYKPEADCWYCRGTSYPAEVCEILEVF